MSDPADDVRAEYASLRDEIGRRSTVQQALFVLNLTAITALVALVARAPAAAADESGRGDARLTEGDLGFYGLGLIPFLSFALARLWLDHHGAIQRLGSYIATRIEPEWPTVGWESSQRASPQRPMDRWLFFGAYVIVFVLPGAFVLFSSLRDAGGVERWAFWSLGLAMTVLNLLGWVAVAIRRRAA